MSEFQHYGVHAIIRPDGDLFVNATAVGLGEAEGRELMAFLMTEYGERDALAAVAEQDQADADALNDDAYEEGEALVIEPEPEVGENSVATAVKS
ncbi:hypothetical protein [Umezawaea sp. NPDC059074]|uniref:hypothetical protein n=1 Tax=Umezawaea sp. NPDC059074 TaxID=3346716 RepID=UPI0036BF2E12